MKSLKKLFVLALLSGCSIAATSHSLLAQTSVLQTNGNLISTGPPAPPPGALSFAPVEATASIDVGASDLVTAFCLKGSCELVGLQDGQTVAIAVQFPGAREGEVVTLEALDGGEVSRTGRGFYVDSDGTTQFTFKAGHPPGVYRVAMRREGQEIDLQFWVLDNQNTANNPPVVNPGK